MMPLIEIGRVYLICLQTAYDFWRRKVSERHIDSEKNKIMAPESPPCV